MSLVKLREKVQSQIDNWFSKPIHIGERVFQILETAPFCLDGWMDSAEIYCSAINYQPSLIDQFIRAGISEDAMIEAVKDMKFRMTEIDYPLWEPNIKITLKLLFPKITEQYKEIDKRNSLTILDLIIANLRATDDGKIMSLLTYHILDTTQMDSEYWNLKNRIYIDNLIKRLKVLEHLDSSLYSQQFIMYWDGAQYRFRPFGMTGGYQFDNTPLKDGTLWIARGNVIQPSNRFKEEAFEELEYLINKSSAEKEFQYFFEKHPEFLLALGGGQYIDLHPQLVLHEDDGGKLIPDFFLEKINDNLCDICDLKLATQALKRDKRHRPGFHTAIHEAVAQLQFYRDWFEDKNNRDSFYNKTGLKAYRPKVVLIIGRRADYYSDIERIRREGLLPSHLELVTYDDVVERARTYLRLVSS